MLFKCRFINNKNIVEQCFYREVENIKLIQKELNLFDLPANVFIEERGSWHIDKVGVDDKLSIDG